GEVQRAGRAFAAHLGVHLVVWPGAATEEQDGLPRPGATEVGVVAAGGGRDDLAGEPVVELHDRVEIAAAGRELVERVERRRHRVPDRVREFAATRWRRLARIDPGRGDRRDVAERERGDVRLGDAAVVRRLRRP